MDVAAWLKLFDSVGFPVATFITCVIGIAIAFTRFLWPFFITQAWPHYLERSKVSHDETLAERDRLIKSIDQQRGDAIGAIDRLRESFSIQLESRSQELMRLIKEISEVTDALRVLSSCISDNTKATEHLLHAVEEMMKWDGKERRVMSKEGRH